MVFFPFSVVKTVSQADDLTTVVFTWGCGTKHDQFSCYFRVAVVATCLGTRAWLWVSNCKPLSKSPSISRVSFWLGSHEDQASPPKRHCLDTISSPSLQLLILIYLKPVMVKGHARGCTRRISNPGPSPHADTPLGAAPLGRAPRTRGEAVEINTCSKNRLEALASCTQHSTCLPHIPGQVTKSPSSTMSFQSHT